MLSGAQNTDDPIKHVIAVQLENQSFTRRLGALNKLKSLPDSIDPKHPHFNLDQHGNKIYQQKITAVQMRLDPNHEVEHVAKQLDRHNGGFVEDFQNIYPDSKKEDLQNLMGYYEEGFLPATHALANEFTVCDHFFASIPGPTWPNRFFALSGTSHGCVKMLNDATDLKDVPELFKQTQVNLFDRLDEKGVSYKCYCGDFPISLVLTHNRTPEKLVHYRLMDQFYNKVKKPEHKFPQFTFIEPRYLGNNQNDDHPPHNTMKTEKLIADIYNAVRSNEELWKKSVIVFYYDEHGGFYDPVVPPKAVPPDNHHEEGFAFDQLGLRVPAIIVSPYTHKAVENTVFDHTSVLRYISDKWDLGELGERTKQANSIAVALDLKNKPRENCLSHIAISDDQLICPNPYLEKRNKNENHKLIHAFADYLNSEYKFVDDQLPVMSTGSHVLNKIGKMLEHFGHSKLSEWCQKDADRHRKARIDHTLKIVGNKLTMFQPKVHSKPEPEPINNLALTPIT